VREELSVKVPAGIESGAKLRIAGRGAAGRFGGPTGDLYLTVLVGPDALFQREGADIVLNQEVPYTAAALGGAVDVPTMEGTKRIRIPAGIQAGTKVRLKGLGFPQAGKARGDMYVRVAVRVPEKLTARQRELIEQLSAEGL
jgi:curved DNA-binding protein